VCFLDKNQTKEDNKMKKNTLNNICFINPPESGHSQIEAVFYYGLTKVNETWYCDVIIINEEIKNPRIVTIKYDNVSFPGDDDRKKWSYILRLAKEQKDKQREKREKMKIKKIATEYPLCFN